MKTGDLYRLKGGKPVNVMEWDNVRMSRILKQVKQIKVGEILMYTGIDFTSSAPTSFRIFFTGSMLVCVPAWALWRFEKLVNL